MKVYLLIDDGYYDNDVIGVFSSEEKAKEYVELKYPKIKARFSVMEEEVDELVKEPEEL